MGKLFFQGLDTMLLDVLASYGFGFSESDYEGDDGDLGLLGWMDMSFYAWNLFIRKEEE